MAHTHWRTLWLTQWLTLVHTLAHTLANTLANTGLHNGSHTLAHTHTTPQTNHTTHTLAPSHYVVVVLAWLQNDGLGGGDVFALVRCYVLECLYPMAVHCRILDMVGGSP